MVVLDNSTLESTKPETPAFVCVFCSEQRALSATYSSHAYAQIVAMGILRSLGTLCIVQYISLFLFFNCGLFSHYKSSSFSQGEKRKKTFPSSSPGFSLCSLQSCVTGVDPLLRLQVQEQRGQPEKGEMVQPASPFSFAFGSSVQHILCIILCLEHTKC